MVTKAAKLRKRRERKREKKVKPPPRTKLASERIIKGSVKVSAPLAEAATDRLFTKKDDDLMDSRIDKVQRVFYTLELMKNRKQITRPQFDAAERYRDAYETCHGGIKSSLDTSNMGGSAPGSRSITPNQMWAADVLNDAAKTLGVIHGYMVRLVAGEGQSFEDVTAAIYGRGPDGKCNASHLRKVGGDIQDALTLLALHWFGEDKMRRHGAFIPGWAGSMVPTPGRTEFEWKPQAAHAGPDHRGVVTVKRGAK